MNQTRIPRQREIIDRRALAEEISALVADKGANARQDIVTCLRGALDRGRAELARRLEEAPATGHECNGGHSFLVDQLVRLLHDHVVTDVYPAANRSSGERLSILAVGGYGRAEMAPHSDVDMVAVE